MLKKRTRTEAAQICEDYDKLDLDDDKSEEIIFRVLEKSEKQDSLQKEDI